MSTSAPASFIVAHRAGNDLQRLRAAEALRLRLVEADVHLFAGRLEVRHRKTVGPLPILWDRWELAPPWAPRMLLDELLAAAGPGTELMLDLKGHDRAAAGARARRRSAPPGRAAGITVCSQDWRLLEPFAAHPEIRVVHSVGNARQLARLRQRDGALAGVSIHERLLDAAVVAGAPPARGAGPVVARRVGRPGSQARRLGRARPDQPQLREPRRGAGLTACGARPRRSSPASPTSTPGCSPRRSCSTSPTTASGRSPGGTCWRPRIPTTRVPFLGVASAYAVGVALNAVLPGRGGDAAKVALVRVGIGGSNVATIASTMSVVVLFDLVAATVLLLAVGATGSIPFAPQLGNLPLIAAGRGGRGRDPRARRAQAAPRAAAAVGRGAAGRRDPAHARSLRAPRRRRPGRRRGRAGSPSSTC